MSDASLSQCLTHHVVVLNVQVHGLMSLYFPDIYDQSIVVQSLPFKPLRKLSA